VQVSLTWNTFSEILEAYKSEAVTNMFPVLLALLTLEKPLQLPLLKVDARILKLHLLFKNDAISLQPKKTLFFPWSWRTQIYSVCIKVERSK
jgi:hypothetical protein